MLQRLFANATPAYAHCDLYCGVYDPAQAKIEALSCLKTVQKYNESDDEHFRTRAILVKEQRAEEVALARLHRDPDLAVVLEGAQVAADVRHAARVCVCVGRG